jgi:hypothetical protein
MSRYIRQIRNNKIKILFILFNLFLFLYLFLDVVKSDDIKFREGIIRYISKPTIVSKPFIFLSTNERFYITNELYQNLIENVNNNSYYYFKIVDNIVYEVSLKPFKDYVYQFPEIFRTKLFEFKDYNIFYILFYYNLSEFVQVEAKTDDNKNLFIYFTSPNSLSIKFSKDMSIKNIKLILKYNNSYFKDLTYKKEYIIKIKLNSLD